MAILGTKHLKLFETADPFQLQTLGPGTYIFQLMTDGNSVLSSLFVSAVSPGASVAVSYYTETTGFNAGEKTVLAFHPTITAPSVSADQIVVTRIHNKTYCEVTVTGGSVTFGIEVTVVSSFAVDLSSALELPNTAVIPNDRGLPVMGVDSITNTFQFLPLKNGKVLVDDGSGPVGIPQVFSSETTLPHSVLTTVFTGTVPTGKIWKLKSLTVSCVTQGTHVLKINATSFGNIKTGPGSPTECIKYAVPLECASDEIITVESILAFVGADVSVTIQFEEF